MHTGIWRLTGCTASTSQPLVSAGVRPSRHPSARFANSRTCSINSTAALAKFMLVQQHSSSAETGPGSVGAGAVAALSMDSSPHAMQDQTDLLVQHEPHKLAQSTVCLANRTLRSNSRLVIRVVVEYSGFITTCAYGSIDNDDTDNAFSARSMRTICAGMPYGRYGEHHHPLSGRWSAAAMQHWEANVSSLQLQMSGAYSAP